MKQVKRGEKINKQKKMAPRAVVWAHFTGKYSVRGISVFESSAVSCGRAKTMRKRYAWTQIFLKTDQKIR